jgi:hypothetical protein
VIVNGGTLQFGTPAQAQYQALAGVISNAGNFSIGSVGLVETLGGAYNRWTAMSRSPAARSKADVSLRGIFRTG